jgi:uncharacterized phiE125 gp8 family phage protein
MNWSLTVVTRPTAEPITVADAKLWLRLDHTAEDTLLESLIQIVREQVEDHGIAVMTQTWDLRLDRFPSVIRIPKTPVQEVSSISYVDANGDTQTLAAANYTVDLYATQARIVPAYGTSWPSTRSEPNAVTVRFIAGYGSGATPAEIPERILHAMRLAITTAYAMRADHDAVQTAVARVLDNYELYYY